MKDRHLPRDQYVIILCAPSRWARVAHGAVSVVLSMALFPCLGMWSLYVGLMLFRVSEHEIQKTPMPLRFRGSQWEQWTPNVQWSRIDVSAHWVGPWMMKVSVAGQPFWLWPDSSTQETLWVLRREFKRTMMMKQAAPDQSQIKWPRLARLRKR